MSLQYRNKTGRIGKAQNEAQRIASKENFALFILAGVHANLSSRLRMLRDELPATHITTSYYVISAMQYIDSAIAAIKNVQHNRKVYKKGEIENGS